MNPDDARRALETLDSGALDRYLTTVARQCLRADALRALDADAPPIARVVAVNRGRGGVRTVVVACPFCPPTTRDRRPAPTFTDGLTTSRSRACASRIATMLQ